MSLVFYSSFPSFVDEFCFPKSTDYRISQFTKNLHYLLDGFNSVITVKKIAIAFWFANVSAVEGSTGTTHRKIRFITRNEISKFSMIFVHEAIHRRMKTTELSLLIINNQN